MSGFFHDPLIPDMPIDLPNNLMRMFKEFECMKLTHRHFEEELDLVKNDNKCLKLKLHQTEEKVNLLEQRLREHNVMSNDAEAQSLQERRLTLQFKNQPSAKIYTGKEIKADDGASLVLELVDAESGRVVDSGQIANSELDIVVLKGDDGDADNWTSREFNRKLVRERKGTKLGGNVTLKLNNGVGVVGDIKFASSAKPMTQGVFKLGARIVGTFPGIHVREGKTQSFVVEDFRNERYEKHETPALDDKLCRLKNISPKGTTLKRLHERQIFTVKDFLVQLFKDPEELKQVVGLRQEKWDETVQNARNCLDKRLCYYIDPDTNMIVVFSLIDQVLGLISSSCYKSIEKLPYNDKANARKLAMRALDDWANVLFADDVASILHFLNLPISREQENPLELELEASGIICDFGNTLPLDNCGGFSVVSQEQRAAPYYDHTALPNTSAGSTFFQSPEHPECLEISPFGSQGKCETGFSPASGMNLINNHEMGMDNVIHINPMSFFLHEIASSSFPSCSASSPGIFVDPLRSQEEAISHFNHWNSIRLRHSGSWNACEWDSIFRNSSSSTNMELVRTTPWRKWLIVAYILSVKWGLLRSGDIYTLEKIEDLLSRWAIIQQNMVHSMRQNIVHNFDEFLFLNAAFKSKKPRTQ